MLIVVVVVVVVVVVGGDGDAQILATNVQFQILIDTNTIPMIVD